MLLDNFEFVAAAPLMKFIRLLDFIRNINTNYSWLCSQLAGAILNDFW